MSISDQFHDIATPTEESPWLVYAYPWMPFPRRVIIYLRERGIPESLVTVVQVRDPGQGDDVVDKAYPPRPVGSLPILALLTRNKQGDYIYIRQSLAIMNFLEEYFNPASGHDALSRARITEILALADECTTAWNPVRTFGTGAGTMSIPAASKEMLRWIRRSLMNLQRFIQDRDMSSSDVTMADIVLFQFFEFVDDCYGVDMSKGSGEAVRDVYGREVKEEFPKLEKFYRTFKTRHSARRDAAKGETPPEYAVMNMKNWAEGVL